MKFLLVLEIALLLAAFFVLHRALRARVSDAERWEISVASQMSRPPRRLRPRARIASEDEALADRGDQDGDCRGDGAQAAVL